MRPIATSILLFLCINLFAISKQDSLSMLLMQARSDSMKIDLLFKLSVASKGQSRFDYLKKTIELDSLYEHKYLGYKPFLNNANIRIYGNKIKSSKYYLEKALYYAEKYNDTAAVAKCYHIYSAYYRHLGKYDSTIYYTKKSRNIYKALKDSFQYYRLLANEAFCYYASGDMEKTESLFTEVITDAIHPRDSWIIASSNLGLGSLMSNKSNYKKALDHNLTAYNIWKDLNDTTYFCRALNNIGIIYKRLSMQNMAISTYMEIIETNPPDDPYAKPLAQANLSTIYSNRKEFEMANELIDYALQKIDSLGNLYYKIALKTMKGEILAKEKKYKQAEPYIQESLMLSKKHNFSNHYETALNIYASILYYTNETDSALKYAEIALNKAEENLNKESLFTNNYLIGKIYAEKGNNARATSYLLKSLELNDSIRKEEEDHNIIESALSYEIGKKEAINESLQKEAELDKIIIEKTSAVIMLQKFFIYIIAISLLLAIVILFLVFKSNKQKKILNQKLHESNNRINDKNKKLQELIAINSKVFSIISHDLKSPIISLQHTIELLKTNELDESTKERIFNSTEIQINTTIELLENLLKWAKTHKESVQVNIEKVDLCPIMQHNLNLIKAAALNKQIDIVTDCIKGIKALADKDMLNLIIRNLLSNAIKFTPRNGSIKLKTKLESQQVVISVEDTGVGIREEDKIKLLSKDVFLTKYGTENEAGNGLGLKLCMHYIKYLNGELVIDSKLGKGSTFTIKIPAFTDN